MLLVVFLSTLRFDLEELADAGEGVDSIDFVVAVVTVKAGEFIFQVDGCSVLTEANGCPCGGQAVSVHGPCGIRLEDDGSGREEYLCEGETTGLGAR